MIPGPLVRPFWIILKYSIAKRKTGLSPYTRLHNLLYTE